MLMKTNVEQAQPESAAGSGFEEFRDVESSAGRRRLRCSRNERIPTHSGQSSAGQPSVQGRVANLWSPLTPPALSNLIYALTKRLGSTETMSAV